MKLRTCLTLLLPWLACLAGWSEQNRAEELWSAGNQAYEAGLYEKAVRSYEEMRAMGIDNGVLNFNLGNAYFRSGRLGKAILHYHKAQYFLPDDEDVQRNLELAMERRVDPQIDEETDSFAHTVDVLLKRLNYTLVFYLALILISLAGLASLGLISGWGRGRPLGYTLVMCGVSGLLLTGVAKVQYDHLTRTDFAVVIATEVQVLSGPSPRETLSFTIHEGMRCQILSETNRWLRIRLANGYNGWILKNTVERI